MKTFALKLGLAAVLIIPGLSNAQVFNYNSYGDVLAGFRNTENSSLYQLVADLGNITNLLSVTPGTTIDITNYSTIEVTNAFINTGGFQNLQWSEFSAFPGGTFSPPWVTPIGTFPNGTIWYTLPATNVSLQTQPPARYTYAFQANIEQGIVGVGKGAAQISQDLGITNIDNTPTVVVEPQTYYNGGNGLTLSDFIGNNANLNGGTANIGNFGANNPPLPNVVENTTPDPFTTPQRDDFYQSVPTGKADPITGSTNGNAYFVGYFILYPDGSETFTRASLSAPPSAGSIISAVTNGFSPLQVVFTNSATGSITSWVWNFGNGTTITNTTGDSVTNTYTSAGDYTVTLTVNGPGGSSTVTVANFIVASPTPVLHVAQAAGNFVLSGTNDPVGVQYRILTSTNLTSPLTGWQPVVTNTFSSSGTFSYTSSTTNAASYFQLVSP